MKELFRFRPDYISEYVRFCFGLIALRATDIRVIVNTVFLAGSNNAVLSSPLVIRFGILKFTHTNIISVPVK